MAHVIACEGISFVPRHYQSDEIEQAGFSRSDVSILLKIWDEIEKPKARWVPAPTHPAYSGPVLYTVISSDGTVHDEGRTESIDGTVTMPVDIKWSWKGDYLVVTNPETIDGTAEISNGG